MTDEILTLMDVANLLSVAEKTVYRLAQRRELPGFKVGGQWRFRRQDLEEWIETKRTGSMQRALAVAPDLGKAQSVRFDKRKNRARQLSTGLRASSLRIFLFNDCELNERQYQLHRAGQPVRLEPEVFEVLLYLIRHRDRFVSRDELFTQLWPEQVVSEAALTRCIAEARKAVSDDGVQQQVIRTQYGRGYRFVATVHERMDASGSAVAATPRERQFFVQSFPSPAAGLLGKPSIAVLPFVNLSCDPEQEYFSDGLTEDLLTALSKLSGLMVIARNSVFLYKGKVIRPEQVSQELGVRYVLSGSVQRDGNQVRITAQLVDGTTAYQLWAERYDRPLQNVFALQDELTQQIVGTLKVMLTREEAARCRYTPTPNLEAYDHLLRGMEHFYRFTRETNAQARQLFEHAIALDPAYAAAYVAAGATHWLDWTWLWSEDTHSLEQALSLVQRALVLDDTLPRAHAQLGSILLMHHQHQQAAAAAQRAIALDPNSACSYATLAEILTFAGQPEEAIILAGKAMQLDPAYAASYSALVGHACRLLRRYDEAIAALKRALGWNPNFVFAHAHLAAVYSEGGWEELARAEIAECQRLSPAASLERAKERVPYKNPADHERFFAVLRKAGAQ